MTNPSGHLRLYVEETTAAQPPRPDDWPTLAKLCGAFQHATGWTLRRVGPATLTPGAIATRPGQVELDQLTLDQPAPTGAPPSSNSANTDGGAAWILPNERVRPLAESLNTLFGDIQRTQIALWQREADLAAGIPVSAASDERFKLAERLQSILQSGAEAIGCEAAALYMLDEATSELKLRSTWGLPRERFLDEPRELRSSIADLEALLGQAVVLDDTSVLPHWRSPEKFPSAVCVPVASPTMPLGTLWIFSREKREFSDDQTNILEIVAGRLAAELERAILLRETSRSKRNDQQSDRVIRWQRGWFPTIEPLIDGWQVAAWTSQDDRVGGEFYDWSVLPSGELSIAVGAAEGFGIEASLTASAARAAFKAHLSQTSDVREVLRRVNETICMSSSGDQWASLGHAVISPETGDISMSVAGRIGAVLVGKRNVETTLADSLPLGTDPDELYSAVKQKLRAGETFVLFSVPETDPDDPEPIDLSRVATQLLRAQPKASAEELVGALRDVLANCEEDSPNDHTFLIVRRKKVAARDDDEDEVIPRSDNVLPLSAETVSPVTEDVTIVEEVLVPATSISEDEVEDVVELASETNWDEIDVVMPELEPEVPVILVAAPPEPASDVEDPLAKSPAAKKNATKKTASKATATKTLVTKTPAAKATAKRRAKSVRKTTAAKKTLAAKAKLKSTAKAKKKTPAKKAIVAATPLVVTKPVATKRLVAKLPTPKSPAKKKRVVAKKTTPAGKRGTTGKRRSTATRRLAKIVRPLRKTRVGKNGTKSGR